MRSFKGKTGKKVMLAAVFVLICAAATALLNYGLIPSNVVRVNLHYLDNGESYDTIFLGTSHGQYGIDPETVDGITGGNSLNLCMADEYPDDSYYILKLACEKQNPKRIVYELDPSYWMLEQRQGSTQIFFYKEFPLSWAKVEYFFGKIMELDFRSTLAPWGYYRSEYANMGKTIAVKQSEAYKNYDPSVLEIPAGHYGGYGFLYRDRIEGEEKGTFNNVPFDESKIQEKAVRYFEKIVRFCEEKGIELIVITTPVPKETTDAYADSYEAADRYFGELMSGYGLTYYNFNQIQSDVLSRSMEGYWDYDGHMDGIRAKEFSQVLGTMLYEMDQGKL